MDTIKDEIVSHETSRIEAAIEDEIERVLEENMKQRELSFIRNEACRRIAKTRALEDVKDEHTRQKLLARFGSQDKAAEVELKTIATMVSTKKIASEKIKTIETLKAQLATLEAE